MTNRLLGALEISVEPFIWKQHSWLQKGVLLVKTLKEM